MSDTDAAPAGHRRASSPSPSIWWPGWRFLECIATAIVTLAGCYLGWWQAGTTMVFVSKPAVALSFGVWFIWLYGITRMCWWRVVPVRVSSRWPMLFVFCATMMWVTALASGDREHDPCGLHPPVSQVWEGVALVACGLASPPWQGVVFNWLIACIVGVVFAVLADSRRFDPVKHMPAGSATTKPKTH